MSLDLIISSKPDEDVIALLKDKKLIEIHTESKEEDKTFAAGDIFLGKVKRTNPGLNAAFVNVGYEKDGFLHYSDLGASYKSFEKAAKIALNGKPSFDFKIEPEIDK
ncbi:MAG: S1 RNA-binding domain-containing protein, partial [Flavobacteriales bacterium]